ncbi:MAG: TRAP transporter TatT component family protein [Candidatus Acetothermia bacterium]|nr:TRAP transporter TatT component family protein [Candidatus Acetothermia bacterium]
MRTFGTVCLALFVGLSAPVWAQPVAELVAQADALFQEVWLTQYTLLAAAGLKTKLETAIDLYKRALAQDAGNIHVLNMLARSCYTLADVFLTKDSDKQAAHAIGQEYGEQSLKLKADPQCVRDWKGDGFMAAVRASTDIEALYWTYANWARKVELGGWGELIAAALRGDDKKLMALMERCLELDRAYLSGGPLRALGGYWAKHPFSKDYDKTKALLEEAVAHYPDYLENQIFYVQYYLIPKQQWAKAREELQKVIDALVGAFPLYNGLAKVKAVDLLGQVQGK